MIFETVSCTWLPLQVLAASSVKAVHIHIGVFMDDGALDRQFILVLYRADPAFMARCMVAGEFFGFLGVYDAPTRTLSYWGEAMQVPPNNARLW